MIVKRKIKKAALQQQTASAPSGAFKVDMSATAEKTYVDLYQKAKAAESKGDYANAHCSTFQMVRDAIKNIIPADPINKRFALRGELSNIFRIRKGRLRICWVASTLTRRVCILYIAETLRKEGDANDPYVVFQSLIDSGRFDEIFEEMGIKLPGKRKGKHP